MDSIDRLAEKIAEMYKINRNPPSTTPRIGVVATVSPLKIKWGDHVILTEDKLYIPKIYREGVMIPNRWQDTNGNMVEDEILWKVELEAGDRVIIAPDEHYKMWYLIERM